MDVSPRSQHVPVQARAVPRHIGTISITSDGNRLTSRLRKAVGDRCQDLVHFRT